MRSVVRIVKPKKVDPQVIERLLGSAPLPVEHVDSPSILVDGEFHAAANRWLRRKYLLRPVKASIESHASRLCVYISYLRNDLGLDHPDQRKADVFAVNEDGVHTFYRSRQFDRDTAVSSATWASQLSTIKQFHEFLRDTYGMPVPFGIRNFINPAGYQSTTVPSLRPRTRTASRGIPITPGWADLLIQGALRIDKNGAQSNSRSVDRDAAAISLALASGIRHGTLASLTTYEVPQSTGTPFATMRVPDFITKGDAGGDALVFAHRLETVDAYIYGARAELIESAPLYKPTEPIHITSATANGWTTQQHGKTRTYKWAETDAFTRQRLVNPDGSSPILLLNSYKPTPLSYDQTGSITTDARNWTRVNLQPDFPERFRTHDLRHTYATHLTICIFKRAVAPYIHHSVADAYLPTRIADAVEITKLSLGHVSETSTRLYIQHAHKMLDIPAKDFLGQH
jgi:hypothetical protein